jgi:polysaccharide export outer membrane protein
VIFNSNNNFFLITRPLFFLTLFLLNSPIYSQSNILSEEFLEGLPPSVREEIEVQNSVQEEADLEALFRSDTSVEKNKVILSKIRKQLNAIEGRLNNEGNEKSLVRFGESFFSSIQSSFMPINIPNFDSSYIVDVGDKFNFISIGKVKTKEELTVQRDGSLLIPSMGKVVVAGLKIGEAENKVMEFIERTAIGVNAFLSLSEVRDIQVILLGGVDNPGIYTLSGGSSILGALNVAGGISEKGSFRKITHSRNGEIIQIVDLYHTFIDGLFSLKHPLRSGDTIFVHPAGNLIPISGGVNNPGIYELFPNETLEDLIKFASGFHPSYLGYNYININRSTINKTSLLKVEESNYGSMTINYRDEIFVPSYTKSVQGVKTVEISGMVNRPGTYHISDQETLESLINRAGGYREGAYVYGGALFRKDAIDKEKLFAQLNYQDTVNYIVSSIGKPNSNINNAALDLLAEELRSKSFSGRIVTDFANNQDVQLEDGDTVFIPSLQKVVYTFGDFKNPSNFEYDPYKSIDDYIELAGSLKDSAYSELIVIDPDGTTHIYNKDRFFNRSSLVIYPGSIIYAPRELGKLSGIIYASTVSPILSSLAISLASLNSISD